MRNVGGSPFFVETGVWKAVGGDVGRGGCRVLEGGYERSQDFGSRG